MEMAKSRMTAPN